MLEDNASEEDQILADQREGARILFGKQANPTFVIGVLFNPYTTK